MSATVKSPMVEVVGLADMTSVPVPASNTFTERVTCHLGSPADPRPWRATEPLKLENAVVEVLVGVAVLVAAVVPVVVGMPVGVGVVVTVDDGVGVAVGAVLKGQFRRMSRFVIGGGISMTAVS